MTRMTGVEATVGTMAGWDRLLSVAVGIPFALGSAAYKGELFSTTLQPGWKYARRLGGYLTNSAIAIGCTELLAIEAIIGQGAAISALRPALFILLAVNVGFLNRVIHELRPALRARREGDRLSPTLVLAAIAGVGVPSFLLILALVFPRHIGLLGDMRCSPRSSSGSSWCAGRSCSCRMGRRQSRWIAAADRVPGIER
jgi:hypothetical protein